MLTKKIESFIFWDFNLSTIVCVECACPFRPTRLFVRLCWDWNSFIMNVQTSGLCSDPLQQLLLWSNSSNCFRLAHRFLALINWCFRLSYGICSSHVILLRRFTSAFPRVQSTLNPIFQQCSLSGVPLTPNLGFLTLSFPGASFASLVLYSLLRNIWLSASIWVRSAFLWKFKSICS